MSETKKLNSVFLTGPGGLIYEIPDDLAKKHIITPERVEELGGHLPISPYESDKVEIGVAVTVEDESSEDVVGHHGNHRNWAYGCYRACDGYYYCGWHRHLCWQFGAGDE